MGMVIIIILGLIVFLENVLLLESFRMLTSLRMESRGSSMKLNAHEPIVVTGMGIISPSGQTVTNFFDNICSGESAVQKVD